MEMETHPSVYSKLTVLTAAKWKISIQEMGLAKQPFFKYRLPDKFHKKIDSGTKCCLFINKMFWLWASDVDLFNTPLPPDFYFSLKDILYLLIDRPWPAPHVNSDTSNMRSVQHLLLWSESHCHGSVREHFLNIYIKKPLKGGNSPLSSLSLYESFYECFSLKIRNSG